MAIRQSFLTYGFDVTSFKAMAQSGIGAALSAFGWTAQSGNGEVNWSNVVAIQPASNNNVPPHPATYRWQGNFVAGSAYAGTTTDNSTNDLVNGSDNNTYMAAQSTNLALTQAIRQTAISFTPSSITSAGASTMIVNCATTIGAGGTNTYVGWMFTLAGMNNANNNGSWICSASTATSLTLNNPSGTNETPSGTPTGTSSANTTSYVGTITNGASNSTNPSPNGAFAGKTFKISGFGDGNDQTTLTCIASDTTHLAFTNSSGVNHSAATAFATSNDQPSTSLWNGGTNGGFWYLYPYETWKNASTTNPIYLKIVYCYQNLTAAPCFQLSVGTAYGTSGTSTGLIGGNQCTFGTANVLNLGGAFACNSKLYECDFSGDSLNFRMVMWRTSVVDAVQGPSVFVIDYARDNAGAVLDTWVMVAWCCGASNSGTQNGRQFIYKNGAGGTGALITRGWTTMMTDNNSTTAFNGSIVALPIQNTMGYVANPQMGCLTLKSGETVDGQLVNVVLYGASHTYLVSKGAGSTSLDPAPSSTSFGASNLGAGAILWE